MVLLLLLVLVGSVSPATLKLVAVVAAVPAMGVLRQLNVHKCATVALLIAARDRSMTRLSRKPCHFTASIKEHANQLRE